MSFTARWNNKKGRFLSDDRIPVQFNEVLENGLTGYDTLSCVFTAPDTGIYAFSVGLEINNTSLVSRCEIKVADVETPIMLNENKTIGRIVLTLDKGKQVCVGFKGKYTAEIVSATGHFSGCMLHKIA